MKKSKPPSRRAEIHQLYQVYAAGLETLSVCALLTFLHKEQKELTANEEKAESLIDRFEINETARENSSMTFEGFLRYMESKECCVFNQAHTSVYQDMNQPLTSYFISTSHNTYLTGDQLVGQSSLDAYVSALRKGCRCLEIDCWDGPDMEPVVYHGHTLTSKILFKDVITTVGQHAFEVSAYPVILSLENHCSREQQEVMAEYLISILGENLLIAPLDHPTAGDLPSPNDCQDLKYKILIKNKKLKHQIKTEDAAEGEESANEGEEEEEEEEEDHQTKAKFWSPRKAGSKKKKKKVVVAEALSDLVIYTRSVKFISFSHSRDNQNCYENTSMEEKKACKLLKASGSDFVEHNQKFLSRIYPTGLRMSSSNYKPVEFWNAGSQLVALNFQSPGLPMDLNDGLFQDNGSCGYVLKPAVLMSTQMHFDPSSSHHKRKSTYLLLKVISGSNLPLPRSGKALDPFVRVEIHGIASDSCRKNTHTVKNNSLSPRWDTDMSFTIRLPELCLVRFCVRDQTGILSSEFVGQYTLPFKSLKKGYRWVPLQSKDGFSLDPASLFVYISHS
ncbi:1-phosphatidylinositol 4,5-bisphosphate phosphodiesterase zeta-1-like isoform X1 [Neolamprologus brichardi]|uniref:1-phosphatidylinositol 4,5-bisphosphate phosphodiesterase zeta-1-like isoform X1 n=1 Tax=Neolamprologus brichardi TaxID=32507 RepID=UPI0003EC1F9D|nr:1-phosphatidylinositol 4,5-bisphosphate phosphodiesterase zeta-1-like isoform X1 [Neolamprologus brichardi]XP_006782670.1 1-phosphatidylinositol 4,5-bisphosphate phosphodiesterase zeta-1-like isoform X1 [Neolamprologus brichardi]XP_006782671.1 1-phosphatidylinositol 4,5-bisphosphate phosphodiesterase zeta-1-like isoform X1 [Neolamprologus brichardi]